MKWSTVTVTDGEGKRYSIDVQAESTYDAAHLFVTHAKGHPTAGLPVPSLQTTFQVCANGKVYTVQGAKLQQWIMKRRADLKGPKGLLFGRGPMLGA